MQNKWTVGREDAVPRTIDRVLKVAADFVAAGPGGRAEGSSGVAFGQVGRQNNNKNNNNNAKITSTGDEAVPATAMPSRHST